MPPFSEHDDLHLISSTACKDTDYLQHDLVHRSTSQNSTNGLIGPGQKVPGEELNGHSHTIKPTPDPPTPTALQRHVLFWDRDNDNIITPHDIYTGFRDLGFSIPFSIGGLLINIFFSYPTRLGHSYLPDPYFRIYIRSIHKAKHGSDTGIYDSDGAFRPDMFEAMFAKFDGTGTGSLGVADLWRLLGKNRVAADPAGWSFAFMEWWTTWLLLQRGGRVWKDDLRRCYDGTLFWTIREERAKGKAWRQGYGLMDFAKAVIGRNFDSWNM